MEDLIPPQIKESCNLALPEGLKDLMSDITREVLRSQPRNLYQFIADYLAAMLITRDNLSVASCICDDICQCSCQPELQDELRDMGIPEDEIKITRDIILNHFEKGPSHEDSIFMTLMKNTSIDEDMKPAIQLAIRKAFLLHQAQNTTVYESSSESDNDEMMSAAKHTLELYRKSAPSEEMYEIMAEKIQKSYRAYGVRRKSEPEQQSPNVVLAPNYVPQMSSSYDIAFPKITCSEEKISEESWPDMNEDPDLAISSSMKIKRISTISSTSLAGSFMNLPSRKPYSAHDCEVLSDLDEYPEREHAYIDYTAEDPHFSLVTDNKPFYKRDGSKKISFSETVPNAAKKMGLEADDDSMSNDRNESLIETVPANMFYRGEVMNTATNYDGDGEMEW